MSDFFDPFENADEAQVAESDAPAKNAAGAVTVDVKPNLLPFDSDGKVVGTFKGGSGFDAPWIVIHATSLQDYHDQISGDNAVLLASAMEQTQKAAKHFAGLGGGSSNGGGQRPQRQAAPAPAQQPPAGSPASPGEGWVYKTGVTKSGPKAGQTWQGWMPPRGSDEKPVFF